MIARSQPAALGAALALATACSGGGSASAPIAGDAATELIACRARVDDPHRFAEIALRDLRNLGDRRVADRSGPELRARLHPDGTRVVFARERSNADPDSREIFVATVDGSAVELRLTQNAARDDAPVWSADGERILFTSERDGPAGLWLMGADGADPAPFLPVPAGFADGEADWHPGTDRIVWSRRDAAGHHSLWLAHGSGSGAVPLTSGGAATGAGSGDHDPAFAPDGATVVFVRRSDAEHASLCLCDVASGAVTVRLAPDGDVGLPRFAPAMDRLFFGLAEPAAGRGTLRLAELPLAGGEPTLLWPDERWQLNGLDLAPAAPAAPAARAPQRLDVERAQVQIAFAAAAFGDPAQLAAADGNEFYLGTASSGGRQVAGINCRFDLPVAAPTDVLDLRVRAIARSTRVAEDSLLRLSIYNPVDERFDTAVETVPPSTAAHTMSFRTSSLRHVTRQKQLRVTVGVDLADGDPAGLWIDLVEVELVARELP